MFELNFQSEVNETNTYEELDSRDDNEENKYQEISNLDQTTIYEN